jgi:transposase
MPFRYSEIGQLLGDQSSTRDKSLDKAATALVEQLVAAGGNQMQARRNMKVDYRTLTRWLRKLRDSGRDVRELAVKELARRVAEAEKTERAAEAAPSAPAKKAAAKAAPAKKAAAKQPAKKAARPRRRDAASTASA